MWQRRALSSRMKRLALGLKSRHSLFAALYRGAGTLTRAQTMQVFLNSISLQLLLCAMLYAPRAPNEPLTINPVKVVVTGTLSAFITTPAAAIFALTFHPVILLRVLFRITFRLIRLLLCCPCVFSRCLKRRRENKAARIAAANIGGSSTKDLATLAQKQSLQNKLRTDREKRRSKQSIASRAAQDQGSVMAMRGR